MEAASSEASARTVVQSELETAQREAAHLSDIILQEKARMVEAQQSWTETQHSLESRIKQLGNQLETSKASLTLSCISFERETCPTTPRECKICKLASGICNSIIYYVIL